MNESDKIELTNELLSRIPPYGEFDFDYDEIKPVINNTPVEEMIKSVAENVKKQNKLIYEIEILQELVFNGFIINRHDIKLHDRIFMQLTDMGRELKYLGSIEAYKKEQDKKTTNFIADKQDKANEAKRNKWGFRITFSIAISTGFAAVYYILEILRIQYHLGLPCHVFFR